MLFITYLLSDLLLYFYHLLQVGAYIMKTDFSLASLHAMLPLILSRDSASVNSLGILICLVISLLSTRTMPFSKSLGLTSFFADSTRPTKSLFSRRSLCSM